MNKRPHAASCLVAVALLAAAPLAIGAGDAARGAQVFGACAACHSIVPDQHATGPSLAHIWNRKAGSVEGFSRYSDALGRSGLVWDEKSLDVWLTNPAKSVPGNAMTFPGIPDARARGDVIAYLKAVSEGKAPAAAGGGMMRTPRLADLKQANAESRVTAIRYCGDAYEVTTGANKVLKFWEFNLRLKTDSSANGPPRGQPVLVPQGMGGDRAQLVFSNPDEISAFVKRCQ
jgi:cytochrome c